MILFPTSLSDEFSPEPLEPDCWKPDTESFYRPCETSETTNEIAPGETMTITHSVWLAEDNECVPNDAYSFEVRGAVDEMHQFPVIGSFTIITEPA